MSQKGRADAPDHADSKRRPAKPAAPDLNPTPRGQARLTAALRRASLGPGPASARDIVRLQRAVGNRAVAQLLTGAARPPQPAHAPSVVQRKPWKGGSNVRVPFAEIQVENQPFQGYLYEEQLDAPKASKTEALVSIAATAAAAGVPPQTDFHTPKSLRTSGVTESGDTNAIAANRQKMNTYNQKIDPFRIKVSGSYGQQQNLKNIALEYQFAQSSYGYVVGIEQGGETYRMDETRGQGALPQAQEQELNKGAVDLTNELYRRYSSAHESAEDEPVHEAAEMGTTNAELAVANDSAVDVIKEALRKRSYRLDAMTKIAGEGSRWQCVRALAGQGKLKNTSRFYAEQDANSQDANPEVYYVTFKTLWGSWKGVFGNQFNIPDNVVADKLRGGGDWGGDGRKDDKRKNDMGEYDYKVG